jgi:adenylylsulfate kinase
MFHDVFRWNRENLPGYFEIYLDVPEEIRKQRDYKNVYRADEDVVGKTLMPELPLHPDLRLYTETLTPEHCVNIIIKQLNIIIPTDNYINNELESAGNEEL